MRLLALVSGGKDSCFAILDCLALGHDIVALANLLPPAGGPDELDSFSFQTVGHEAIEALAQCADLPLYRRRLHGTAVCKSLVYNPRDGDEVEDLFALVQAATAAIPDLQGVCTGALLSDYQRLRVEDVCGRLGLVSVAPLWRRDQTEMLDEQIASGLVAVLVKVASLGLDPHRDLGKTLSEMRPRLHALRDKFGCSVCGEGGEYETLTLDCPAFPRRIVIDESTVVAESTDPFAPVGYLRITRLHVEDKATGQRVDAPATVIDADGPALPLDVPDVHTSGDAALTSSRLIVGNNGMLYLGNVHCADQSMSAASQIDSVMTHIEEELAKHSLCLSDVLHTKVHVARMSDFAILNKRYGACFPKCPPVRSCIEVAADHPCVSIDLAARRGFADASLHVQSVSHWAAANIGPYSQAIRVGSVVHVAGQIGLVPHSMVMASGIAEQTQVALSNLWAVLGAMDAHHVCSLIVFTTTTNVESSAKPLIDAAFPTVFVCWIVVPALPRNGLVELECIASCSQPQSHSAPTRHIVTVDDAPIVTYDWSTSATELGATRVFCVRGDGVPVREIVVKGQAVGQMRQTFQ